MVYVPGFTMDLSMGLQAENPAWSGDRTLPNVPGMHAVPGKRVFEDKQAVVLSPDNLDLRQLSPQRRIE